MIHVTKSELPSLSRYNSYLKKIWKTAWLTNNGALLQELESKLLQFLGIPHISMLSNGTLALQFAIRALHAKQGSEIITTPFTFVATTNAILYEGLTPVFADIDPETFTISPSEVEKKITKKTKAILAVHVYGNPCDVTALSRLAKKYGIALIYDAAHAFGVEYAGKSVLAYGDMSTLSFHATKVFNTIEGGAVVSTKKTTLDYINLLRNFGILSEEKSILAGVNAKMNEFQAAMGLCNLQNVERSINRRKQIYNTYVAALSDNKSFTFQKLIASKYNYAYMPVLFPSKKIRDTAYVALSEVGIKPRKYFYPLVTDFEFISKNLKKSDVFPNAQSVADRVLCLPLYSTLAAKDVQRIIRLLSSL